MVSPKSEVTKFHFSGCFLQPIRGTFNLPSAGQKGWALAKGVASDTFVTYVWKSWGFSFDLLLGSQGELVFSSLPPDPILPQFKYTKPNKYLYDHHPQLINGSVYLFDFFPLFYKKQKHLWTLHQTAMCRVATPA